MSDSQRYTARVSLPVSVEEAFAYHQRPGALQRLIPPWQQVELEHSDDSLAVGSRVVLKTKIAGVPVRWLAEHTHYDPPRLFADTQVSGPFAAWDHRHEFSGDGDSSELCDQVTYQLPLGGLVKTFGSGLARRAIGQMFAYRQRVTHDDLQLSTDRPCSPLTVAVSGSTGLMGSSLSTLLTLLGHQSRAIVRSSSDNPADIAVWTDPAEGQKLGEVDAVVHLAGKPIAQRRWSEAVKQQIRDSRVVKTRQLCESLASLPRKPQVLVCASASGIYGDRGDEVLNEDSPPGDDFLATVAQQWEQACQPAREAGIRVVHARFGVVLSPQGGALQKMLLPAKFAGGSLGGGTQWWSWIALDDAIGAIYHAITDANLSGPVNFVSPQPVTNAEFAKCLGRVLNRPAVFPAPTLALRAMLGEMADALLLASARVEPARLQAAGYRFRFTDLEDCLHYWLGRHRKPSQHAQRP